MFDWDDLRYFLAVARNGSTIAAAKALKSSQSTVQRRLVEFERRIGRRIASRDSTGYKLTEFGQTLLPIAEQVEASVKQFERHVGEGAGQQTGVIRVTCPEPIVQRMRPLIERFHAKHSNLRVEFVMSDRYLDLNKGEADVAFRSGDTDDELVGRKIADSIWGIYASRRYIEAHGKPDRMEDIAAHPLVGFDEAMRNHRVSKWLAEGVPHGKIVARNSSVLGMVYAIKSGIGIGPLPLPIGDAEPELVRLFGPVPELSRTWRLLTHPDLRHAPRIAAFFDFVIAERDALKSILTG